MIIDAHCHAGAGDGFTGPWDTRAPLARYLVRARRAGVDKTVIFPAFSSDYEAANREVAALVQRRPHRLIGFACVHAERDRGRVSSMLDDAVNRHGLVGVKVHRHDARISREVCDAARRLSLPILYDPAGETEIAYLLGEEFPEVPFIFPHLGSFGDDWRAQIALLRPLARYPNLYADTSGVRRFDVLQEAAAECGAHKLIFGSDGPWLHPGVEIEKVRLLRLAPAEERAVLGGNLCRLLRMK